MTVQIKLRAADRAPTRDRGDGAYSIAPDLAYLRLSIVNIVYSACKAMATVVWVLIDAGLPTSQGSIIHVAQKRFGSASRPATIILTLGYFDHVGKVRSLATSAAHGKKSARTL